MATYYIDFEGGNDANAGTSFATRWKTITNGATAARIAPGDEIRIMASPDPTSIGTGIWTGGGRPRAVSITSSTNATPIVVTTATAHGLTAGKAVSIVGHTTNTNANGVWQVGTVISSTQFQILQQDGSNTTGNGVGGASGTVTDVTNCMVFGSTSLTKNIALCGGQGQKPAWTPSSANAAAFFDTGGYKEGYGSMGVQVLAAFTTGKVAHYTLPATLDLSAYQQVSFWVQLFSGTVGGAGHAYLALCSDTSGNTVVHQCPIPALGATGVWVPVTVNLGTNLSATINSVAFYIAIDNGAQIFRLDNIIACKAASSADSINLQSLISKSDGTGDEAWYAIQSINSGAIMLSNGNSLVSTSPNIRGYNGTNETVTTYKRETVKTTPAAGAITSVSTINNTGTSANPITFSGGWNRTDMSTQTGRTWLDGLNGYGRGLTADLTARSFITVDRLDFCRYNTAISNTIGAFTNCTFTSMYATANSSGVDLTGIHYQNITFTSVWANNNGGTGFGLAGLGNVVTNAKLISNNAGSGFYFNSSKFTTVGSLIAGNNATTTTDSDIRFGNSLNCVVGSATLTNGLVSSAAIQATNSYNCYINGGSSSGHNAGVSLGNSFTPANINLNNFVINEAAEVITSGAPSGFVYSNRHDNTDNNSWIFQPSAGTVNQQTSVVDSPATTAWQMRPTSTDASSTAPITLKLGTVVCAAGSLVTVTARMRRDDTGLTMRLVCPGGQISGVSSDVTSDMTAAANTWETVTITFTPTKPGGVDIYAYAFGGTTYSGYVCNLTASQA